MTEGAMEELIKKQNQLLEDMKRAIADGVLSNQDKKYILQKTRELQDYISSKGNITTEEEQILHKVQTTYNLIIQIEKEYLNQYINYLKKK
ncbi:MAG: hypothetical protein JSV49_00395 [Thermoplasmata archaeon]|nr:MAG: hypothetical protein JSV49_00395 [Thermoplasmata archaeon]